MPTQLRLALGGLACLLVGFLAGWHLQPAAVAPITVPSATTTAATPVAAPTAPVPSLARSDGSNEIAAGPSGIERRRELLSWLKEHNFIFRHWGSVGPAGFDRGLALILGLTPDELAALDAATAQADKQVREITVRSAVGHISEDGKTLLVTVPSQPAEGAEIYGGLLATVRRVLGPERYELFNEVAGEGFEQAFDRYGLTSVNYELNLQPFATPGQASAYILKSSYVDPENPTSRGWSSTGLARLDPKSINPVVAKFLPANPAK